jgi:hypothetical protein
MKSGDLVLALDRVRGKFWDEHGRQGRESRTVDREADIEGDNQREVVTVSGPTRRGKGEKTFQGGASIRDSVRAECEDMVYPGGTGS